MIAENETTDETNIVASFEKDKDSTISAALINHSTQSMVTVNFSSISANDSETLGFEEVLNKVGR